MSRNVNEIIKTLSPAQRKKVEEMAMSLHVAQKQISEIEKRTDMLISTLRWQIEAMDGSLVRVATFRARWSFALAYNKGSDHKSHASAYSARHSY